MPSNTILQDLLQYKKVVDSDDVRFKQIIKEKLVNDERIIYVLNNKDLEDASDYFGVNILDYYLI